MKISTLIVSVIVLASSFTALSSVSWAGNDSYEDCKILMPHDHDKQDHYCREYYGVTYNGYLIEDKCYPSPDEALSDQALLESRLPRGRAPVRSRPLAKPFFTANPQEEKLLGKNFSQRDASKTRKPTTTDQSGRK